MNIRFTSVLILWEAKAQTATIVRCASLRPNTACNPTKGLATSSLVYFHNNLCTSRSISDVLCSVSSRFCFIVLLFYSSTFISNLSVMEGPFFYHYSLQIKELVFSTILAGLNTNINSFQDAERFFIFRQIWTRYECKINEDSWEGWTEDISAIKSTINGACVKTT